MSMEEKRKITRVERATTVGPLDRPNDDMDKPLPSTADKPLPNIKEPIPDLSRLSLQETPSIDQETRKALTDPRLFETVPAAFSLTFVLGKQPANHDSLSLDELLSQGQYYLVVLRTQHLLTTDTSLSIPELWSLWLLRAESLRLLLAPRLAALELTRIHIPPAARIPWDFQVLKILLVGMASGRWSTAISEWLVMASETRLAMSQTTEKQIWRQRLKKLQDLIIYGLIEAKDFDVASRRLTKLRNEDPRNEKYVVNLFHVYLQMGHLSLAENLIPSLPTDIQSESTALLAIAKEDYTAAINIYSTLLQSEQRTLQYTNNIALTYLYTANAQSSISALEPELRKKGNIGVLPHAVYNLCTMYEIRDDKARSRKEGIMESVVGLYGDVCGKGHFKLDSLR